ncbi:MAG: hypothetical protein HXL36_03075 [Prevotellaceae bacterium]|nr:hypothetical protein [Prevotellaceae bacterium]
MTVIFIIIGGLVLYALYKNSKAKDITHKDDANIKVTILTSTDDKAFHESKGSDYKSHREQMRLRDKRRERKYTIWSVLRFMITYKALMEETTNFYQFRDNYAVFKTAKGEMRKRHPDTNALNTAIRFCRMEYFYETCKHNITEKEIQTLYDWKNLTIDDAQLLNSVLINFDKYWKGVLNSYVRPSARINRIKYLIDELDEIKTMETILSYPNIVTKIDELRKHYESMLQA